MYSIEDSILIFKQFNIFFYVLVKIAKIGTKFKFKFLKF